jgi:DNA-directed RNA polymerase I subunit RPA43
MITYYNYLPSSYVSEVDGVVLAYGSVQFLQRQARIMYDSPFSHFFISTSLLVWRPVIGMVLGRYFSF